MNGTGRAVRTVALAPETGGLVLQAVPPVTSMCHLTSLGFGFLIYMNRESQFYFPHCCFKCDDVYRALSSRRSGLIIVNIITSLIIQAFFQKERPHPLC